MTMEDLRTTTIATVATMTNCPICHAAGFSSKETRFLGIFKTTHFVCLSCGAQFLRSGKERFVLKNFADKTASLWSTYANQSLLTREWMSIGNGGMSDVKQREADMETYMNGLRTGETSVTCVNAPSSVLLKNGETVVVAFPRITLKESRSIRVSSGSYGGPSFRVARGLYFRVGSISSTSSSRDVIKDIDSGVLTITNQRFIFSGAKKSLDVPFRKITGIDPFSDGIALHREGYQKTQYFNWIGNLASLNITVDQRSYKEPLSGLVLKYIIEGLAHKVT